LVDLNSRYGTFLRSSSSVVDAVDDTSIDSYMQLSTSAPLVIVSDAIFRFGTSDAKVRFVRKHFTFCTTRLDKSDRDLLKKRAKAVGAKLVEEVQLATHVVSSKAAATVKTLSAIVSNIPIVNMNWLDFVDTEGSCETIPHETDCPPSTLEDFKIVGLMGSRSGLLANHSVYLTDPIDEQYVCIAQGCGGRVVRLYPTTSINVDNAPAVQVRTRKAAIAQQKTPPPAVYDIVGQLRASLLLDATNVSAPVVFFDETGPCRDSPSLSAPCLQLLHDSGAEWLTVGQLAAAVLSCQPPVLTSHPPSMLQQGGDAQLHVAKPKLAHSQLFPSAEKSILTDGDIGVIVPINAVKEQQQHEELIVGLEGVIEVENHRLEGKGIESSVIDGKSRDDRSSTLNTDIPFAVDWSDAVRVSKKSRLDGDSCDDGGGRSRLTANASTPLHHPHPVSLHESAQIEEKCIQLAAPGHVSTSYYYESDSIQRMPSASADDTGKSTRDGVLCIRDVKKFTKNAVSVATEYDTMRFRKFDLVLPKETDREIQVSLCRSSNLTIRNLLHLNISI